MGREVDDLQAVRDGVGATDVDVATVSQQYSDEGRHGSLRA
jgi:hypothetical protein